MARKLPSHLKLHTEESAGERTEESRDPKRVDLPALMDAFTQATGWIAKPLQRTPHHPEAQDAEAPALPLDKRMRLVSTAPIDGMLDAELTEHVTGEQEAWALLAQIDALVQQLKQAEATIEGQEAQLATAVGVSVRKDEGELLARRMQESLERAAQQTHSDAAAIYLLDETTSELKMRSCWGMPKSALAESARPLRGSLADLEALMGNAVLIENTKHAPEWNCPEDYAAGMCLPIGSPTMPQGTIWLWSEHVRDFNAADIDAGKSASEKILVDIERSVLADEVLKTRSLDRQLESASLTQSSRLPSLQPLHEDYEIGGWTYQSQALGGNFHTWTVNRHQHICAALGSAAVKGAAGALIATSVQTVVETCWQSRHQPAQVLRKANDILVESEDGDWRSSLFYMQMHPESGSTQVAMAGDTQAFLLGAHGHRMVTGTPTRLGAQPDTSFENSQLYLEGGELLVVASADVLAGAERGGFSQDEFLALLKKLQEEAVADIADHLARQLPMDLSEDRLGDRSLLIVRRRF